MHISCALNKKLRLGPYNESYFDSSSLDGVQHLFGEVVDSTGEFQFQSSETVKLRARQPEIICAYSNRHFQSLLCNQL